LIETNIIETKHEYCQAKKSKQNEKKKKEKKKKNPGL